MDPSRPCLNCGDPTHGEFCPTCGQRKVDVQVSLRTLLMDVMEDQFILDRRLPRTLSALLFQPGHLTVEHVNGRIVRHIHPFRLYLVSSIIFFILLSFFSLELVRQALDDGVAMEVESEGGTLDQGLADLRLELADTTLGPTEVAALRAMEARLLEQRREARIDSVTASIANLRAGLQRLDEQIADTDVPAPVRGVLQGNRSMIRTQLEATIAHRDALLAGTEAPGSTAGTVADTIAGTAAVSDTTGPRPRGIGGDDDRPLREVFGWTGEDRPRASLQVFPAGEAVLNDQIDRILGMTARDAAETLVGTFFNYAPTMMFILLPVFAAVLKLLYIRRRRFYAEHFVFLLHVHSMVFILATAMLLLRSVVGLWLDAIVGLWILLYIYLAMKRVYGQGWLMTFVKYWILGWTYFWILGISIPIAGMATILLF